METWTSNDTLSSQSKAENLTHNVATLLTKIMLLYTCLIALDPSRSGWGTVNILSLKYGSTILTAMAIFLYAIGGIKQKIIKTYIFWSTLLFSMMMILGGVFSVYFQGEDLENTFLGRGLSVLAAVLGLTIASNRTEFEKLSRITQKIAYIYVIVGFTIMLSFEMGWVFGELGQVYQTELFLITASAIWISTTSKRRFVKYVFFLLMLITAVESGKATSYLLLTEFIFVVFVLRNLKIGQKEKRRIPGGRLTLLICVTPLLILFAWYSVINNGAVENDLRYYLWQVRIEQFISQPYVGTFFYGSPLLPRPNLPNVGVPTHNDYLDILSQGGIFGMSFFMYILIKTIKSPLLSQAMFGERSKLTSDHFYAFVFVSWIIASLGNPVFFTPYMAIPAWFAMGVLCAWKPSKMEEQFLRGDKDVRSLDFKGSRSWERLKG